MFAYCNNNLVFKYYFSTHIYFYYCLIINIHLHNVFKFAPLRNIKIIPVEINTYHNLYFQQ